MAPLISEKKRLFNDLVTTKGAYYPAGSISADKPILLFMLPQEL